MKTIIAGIIISLALALAPAPKLTVQNPKLLFAAAMYKTAVGDTDSALRLIHRAEQARPSAGKVHPAALQTACDRSASLFSIL
jgi:hypothetical protein